MSNLAEKMIRELHESQRKTEEFLREVHKTLQKSEEFLREVHKTLQKTEKATREKAKRKSNKAFMRPLSPSSDLAAVIGASPVSRTQAVKKLWDYIRRHNLQNPRNRRNIIADEKLRKVFGKDEVIMFELAGILNKHLR